MIKQWEDFKEDLWQKEINVRDFIQKNYKLYEGDGGFLIRDNIFTYPTMSEALNDLF